MEETTRKKLFMKTNDRLIVSISSDIGYELAIDWINRGFNVFGTYRTMSENCITLKELGVELIECDLLNTLSVSESINSLNKIKDWDAVVISSGSQEPIGPFIDCSFDDWENSLRVNFSSPMRLLQGILKNKTKKTLNQTKVILFAGGGSNGVVPNYSAYTSSKIALIKMCELLSEEIGDITITILGPGWVNTKIHQETLKAGKSAGDSLSKTIESIRNKNFYPLEKVIQCINWILNADKNLVNGRNFSSANDPWEHETIDAILSNKNNFKLRRYGNDLFKKEK